MIKSIQNYIKALDENSGLLIFYKPSKPKKNASKKV